MADRFEAIEARLDSLSRILESRLNLPAPSGTQSPLPSGSPAIGLAPDICWPPPHDLPLPRDCVRRMKPIRKSLADSGYFKPTFGLSKRNERKELFDTASPWKSMYEAAVQARMLLGPPPDPTDARACDWFTKLETLFVNQQAQSLYELCLVEAKRIAPNLSKDRQVSIVTATWPRWSTMVVELHAAQERALTTSLLSRKPAGSSDDRTAGKDK